MTGNTESSFGRERFPGTERIVLAPVASQPDGRRAARERSLDANWISGGLCRSPESEIAMDSGGGRDGGATTQTGFLGGAPLEADAPAGDRAALTSAGGGPAASAGRTRRLTPASASRSRPRAATIEEVPMVPGPT